MRRSFSGYSSACIAPTNSAARESASPSFIAWSPATADGYGPKGKSIAAPCSRSHCPKEMPVNDFEAVEILLAEDSDADAELTMRALRKGSVVNNIVRVRDGVEALEFVFREGAFSQRRGGQPRLILLDLKMPRLGGIDVLRRLKADEKTKLIPVVILTSSAEEQDVLESYRLGVNSYLVKPVEFSAFTNIIAQTGLYWAVMNRIPG